MHEVACSICGERRYCVHRGPFTQELHAWDTGDGGVVEMYGGPVPIEGSPEYGAMSLQGQADADQARHHDIEVQVEVDIATIAERHRIAIHLRLKGRRLMDEGRYLAGHVLIEEADRIEAGGKLLE